MDLLFVDFVVYSRGEGVGHGIENSQRENQTVVIRSYCFFHHVSPVNIVSPDLSASYVAILGL